MYESAVKRNKIINICVAIFDVVFTQLSFVLAYFIRFGLNNPYDDKTYFRLSILLLVSSVLSATLVNQYKNFIKRGKLIEFRSTIVFTSVFELIIILILAILKETSVYSRAVLLLLWAISTILIWLERLFIKKLGRNYAKNHKEKIILIIPSNSIEEKVLDLINDIDNDYSEIVAIATRNNKLSKIDDLDAIDIDNGFFDYVTFHVIDGIYISGEASKEFNKTKIDMCIEMGIAVHNQLDENINLRNQIIEGIGNTTVLTSSAKSINVRQMIVKKTMDIIGGLVGCVISLIIIVISLPFIIIQSPGPIIFKQRRVGKNGRVFNMYKIRTMCINAEEQKTKLISKNRMNGYMFKVDDDPRVYPYGEFLRKHSLDEFPQFFNVLKGDMSIVGTRPPTLDEYEKYEYKHKKRLSIKPGITGLWQVKGRNNITDFEEIVKLDAEYISSWRLLNDIKIILQTIIVLFTGKGAQ